MTLISKTGDKAYDLSVNKKKIAEYKRRIETLQSNIAELEKATTGKSRKSSLRQTSSLPRVYIVGEPSNTGFNAKHEMVDLKYDITFSENLSHLIKEGDLEGKVIVILRQIGVNEQEIDSKTKKMKLSELLALRQKLIHHQIDFESLFPL